MPHGHWACYPLLGKCFQRIDDAIGGQRLLVIYVTFSNFWYFSNSCYFFQWLHDLLGQTVPCWPHKPSMLGPVLEQSLVGQCPVGMIDVCRFCHSESYLGGCFCADPEMTCWATCLLGTSFQRFERNWHRWQHKGDSGCFRQLMPIAQIWHVLRWGLTI